LTRCFSDSILYWPKQHELFDTPAIAMISLVCLLWKHIVSIDNFEQAVFALLTAGIMPFCLAILRRLLDPSSIKSAVSCEVQKKRRRVDFPLVSYVVTKMEQESQRRN
jgi:hypothetical protein